MAKTYELGTMVSPTSLLEKARKAASENGAILVGDERSGRFSHESVRGEYHMAGRPWWHHNGEALAAVLARGGGPLEGARTLASLSLAWKAARGSQGGRIASTAFRWAHASWGNAEPAFQRESEA